jgi:hypothetical protein
MLLSGLFFFRTFTPVFFWSKGKIEELSYFKMKSKLHIQLYTLPSTPFLEIPLSEPEAVLALSKKGVEGSVYN